MIEEDDVSGYNNNEYANIDIDKDDDEINAYDFNNLSDNFTDEDDEGEEDETEDDTKSDISSASSSIKPKKAKAKMQLNIYNSILQEESDFAAE
jgi:hypothetical protein